MKLIYFTLLLLARTAFACGPAIEFKGTLKVLKNEPMVYECQDSKFKPTGKSSKLPFCILTLQDPASPESSYKAGAEAEACDAKIGAFIDVFVEDYCSDAMFTRTCDNAGKRIHADRPLTLSGAIWSVGLQWGARKVPTLESSRIWKTHAAFENFSFDLPSCTRVFGYSRDAHLDSSECVGLNLPEEIKIETNMRVLRTLDKARTRVAYVDAGPVCDLACRKQESKNYWAEREHRPQTQILKPPGTEVQIRFPCGKKTDLTVSFKMKDKLVRASTGHIDDLKKPDLVRLINSIRCK